MLLSSDLLPLGHVVVEHFLILLFLGITEVVFLLLVLLGLGDMLVDPLLILIKLFILDLNSIE